MPYIVIGLLAFTFGQPMGSDNFSALLYLF